MPDYRLDPVNQKLSRDGQDIPLSLKAFAVLRYLIEHRRRLVTKEALFEAVWPNVLITEDGIRHYILELRKAFDDPPKTPRFIETVHGLGYRFIGEVALAVPPPLPPMLAEPAAIPAPTPFKTPASGPLTGRERELGELRAWLAQAMGGERKFGFVSGGPGLGKTALVSAFLESLDGRPDIRVARGQCSELLGTLEPFMPIQEAIEELCGGQESGPWAERLRSYAPGWCSLLPCAATCQLGGDGTARPTRERLVRELAQFLESASGDRTLVLWFEDLHWADASTLNLLAYLALRRQAARLLVLGTQQPVETQGDGHPLRRLRDELRKRGHYTELALPPLEPAAVADYLETRCPGLPAGFGAFVQRHAGGHPLLMVRLVEHALARAWLVREDGGWQLAVDLDGMEPAVPDSLLEWVEQQLERLDAADQGLLETASVAGRSFSAASLAAALDQDIESIEARCQALAKRRQFIERQGVDEWPDGTVAAQYGFVHALHHRALHERVTPSRRAKLRKRMGERMALAYGDDPGKAETENGGAIGQKQE